MTHIICKFCHNPVPYTPLEEMEIHGIKVYFCELCSAEYTFWQDGDPMSENLYVTIKEKLYQWNYSPATDVARLWWIKNPGVPGVSKNLNFTLLHVFKYNIPDITPSNFENKLKTYLILL